MSKLQNDDLGFPLIVSIEIGDFEHSGTHRTTETIVGKRRLVPADAPHTIQLQHGLDPLYLTEVISHEVYHLFYSVRHLITVDEEEQATIFGQLVKHIHEAYQEAEVK